MTRDQALVTSSQVLAVVVGQLLLGGFLAPRARAVGARDDARRLFGFSRR